MNQNTRQLKSRHVPHEDRRWHVLAQSGHIMRGITPLNILHTGWRSCCADFVEGFVFPAFNLSFLDLGNQDCFLLQTIGGFLEANVLMGL